MLTPGLICLLASLFFFFFFFALASSLLSTGILVCVLIEAHVMPEQARIPGEVAPVPLCLMAVTGRAAFSPYSTVEASPGVQPPL